MERHIEPIEQAGQAQCRCPFCDNALQMPYPFCQACGAEVHLCGICGRPLPRNAESCPHCSGEE